LRRIESVHPVAQVDGQAFVRGGRLKLRRGIVEAAALRALAELQAIGVLAEVEANRPPDEAILSLGSIDQFQDSDRDLEPVRPYAGRTVDVAKLSMLDDDEQSAMQPLISREHVASSLGEEGETHREARPREDGPTNKLSMRAPDVPTAPMQLPSPHDRSLVIRDTGPPARNPFAPPDVTAPMLQLQLDRRPAPAADPGDALGSEGTTSKYVPPSERQRSLLPTVEQPAVAGGPRQNPALRIGIGAVVGLLLGWMMSQPYAGRAERHVAELRAEANKERYRPVDEARARVAALDERADAEATHGALGSGLIWLLVGGAAFAAWWRFTKPPSSG
jgi:hypothetical protein